MTTRTHLPALVALLLGAAGCGFALDTGGVLVANECELDSDCPGALCDTTLRMCIAPSADPLSLWLEVTPATDPVGGTPTTRSLGPFLVDGPSQAHLELPAPINVFGNVRMTGTGEAVTARLRFVREPAFVGAPAVAVETNTVADPVPAFDGMPADYALRVVAEVDYQVVVEPTGEWAARVPPRRLPVPVPGGGDSVRIDIEYPADMPVLSGVVMDGAEAPVDDLLVRVVDVESGLAASSTSITGAEGEPGTFRVVIDPAVTSWVIRIRAGSEDTLFPTLFADPALLFPDELGNVRILVPMLSHTCYEGTVGIEADATGFETVPGAVLSFVSTDVFDGSTGVTGSFRTTATADATGTFSVEVLPGTYEVLVTPPDTRGDVGVLAEVVRVELPPGEDCLRGQRFQVPPRAALTGSVRTPDGREMPSATVSAIALGWEPASGVSPAARYNRSNDTTTGPTGLFTLPLDIGSYDVAIKPPPGSRFPWLLRPELTFDRSDVTVMEPFELSAPVPLAGTVVEAGPEAMPSAGAEIRAYAILELADGRRRAVPVARTVAEEDGSYLLLLPPQL